ncbi:DUF3817 domain-containing protein [Kribbella sp. NPDC051770]|uniref:DUF3817 domain-containing protein n=1 Tax=Kribbella sp. NPDC051770 TaxID=3155413 RepID=UPI0034123EF1
MRALRIAATIEIASLAILLGNLFTVHWPPVASLLGPIHGCCYLAVVALTARTPGATTRTKLLALIPAIGGLLVLRRQAVAQSN